MGYVYRLLVYSSLVTSNLSVAARRAALGHPEPFDVKYIEIGNEDFFAPDSFAQNSILLRRFADLST